MALVISAPKAVLSEAQCTKLDEIANCSHYDEADADSL